MKTLALTLALVCSFGTLARASNINGTYSCTWETPQTSNLEIAPPAIMTIVREGGELTATSPIFGNVITTSCHESESSGAVTFGAGSQAQTSRARCSSNQISLVATITTTGTLQGITNGTQTILWVIKMKDANTISVTASHSLLAENVKASATVRGECKK